MDNKITLREITDLRELLGEKIREEVNWLENEGAENAYKAINKNLNRHINLKRKLNLIFDGLMEKAMAEMKDQD